MPPSGCYFSRDNKNYRLSGLENNRSSGLPLDRGLHSLRLDTQAVAALRCSLFPSLHPPAPFCALFFLVARLFTVSVSTSSSHPLIVALSGPGTPFDAPEGPPSRSFAPRCPLATSSRPVTRPLACLETLLQPEVLTCIKPLQPAVHYHFTYYTL